VQASASSIDAVWNLAQAEDVFGIDISDYSLIVEIGGGYGQVCNIQFNTAKCMNTRVYVYLEVLKGQSSMQLF
jgi:hypothetical protein